MNKVVTIDEKILRKLVRRVVWETRTCPETIGLKNSFVRCPGWCHEDKASKCIRCFLDAVITKPKFT